ncbi:primosomal protein N' [Sideroxydans lithotrophicus]|uniref:Replication restart protein PriA n=1 Tax=Sideroxydans lithotrophicus (strain ES-1) TaxID=580332 RepID=D5CTQ4_SIDLE|nr:primosomal protein N' [Sideroxydans lithotrophicus]ADE10360.1 primosomal protein N' [Sideroxydans lithotrophicus ES-1]
MPIIRVALDVPLSTLFDYVVSEEMRLEIGQRVVVPFRRKQALGVAMEWVQETALAVDRIKPVTQVLDDVPPLPQELLALLRFCSDYYHYPLGMTVLAALPTRLRAVEPITVKQALDYTLSAAGRALDIATLPKRRVVQQRILQALRLAPLSGAQMRTLSPSAPAALKSLLEAGWVECVARKAGPLSNSLPQAGERTNEKGNLLLGAHALTDEQQQAVDAVTQQKGYGCFLLHGITGSGKTEIYVHLMHEMLQRSGQILLLVPEINLTPQLENYFRSRFPDVDLVSLHSGLADGERAQNWLKAQSGDARIVLGTRLSVFAPLPKLSLILVDEEHDPSFKQQDGLRYSARDVAIFRANQRGVPIVLGSATPSLESWFNAQSGRYKLLKLTQRAVQPATLPVVRCMDITKLPLQDGLSEPLLTAIETRLQRKEQSLIFINRRGYAPVLMCTSCGWLSECKHCAGKLVLHQKDRSLRCHHCGAQQRVPNACPTCGDADLKPVGIGTQRLEETLQTRFPNARILRVDRDSTRNKGAWSAMRKQIHDGEADILIGTQMLAKGHDFPNLTLVGVISPDGALYSADFRASEKLFAQLTQVGGRAGRADKAGEVIMQTAFPNHPLFQALRAHNYEIWAQTLLAERQMAGFPPFVYQALLSAEGKQESDAYNFLKQARSAAMELHMPVEVYGVVPAAMPKRANHHRAQLLVQSDKRKALGEFLRAWKPILDALPAGKLRWVLDVDPMEF